uniref:Subtilisin-like protease fibronectin type-III domain-containing protein n=1 Tax=Salix viminalis TaxID=40686 RepID=A0A6N2MK39_SALVM
MFENTVKWLVFILAIYLAFNAVVSVSTPLKRKTYIVQMDRSAKPGYFTTHLEWYSSKVQSVLSKPEIEGQADEEDRIIYSYETAFHGVAAKLNDEEAERLEEEDGVVALFPETKYQLHTTRSPMFLGLEPEDSTSVWSEKVADHGVIVGVLDTGIFPESESFNDTGMSPVPTHWKGICETGRGFQKHHCNKKIVGARVFYRGYEAATAKSMSKMSINRQEIKMVMELTQQLQLLALQFVEQICWATLMEPQEGWHLGLELQLTSSDILSAVDRAVADGVNVLSISLGGGVSSYYRDSLSIAAFGSMEMGVFVSCSAGNAGPDPASLTNVSPWITTIFQPPARLGTGRTLSGVSLYKGRRILSTGKQYPLVYMGGNSSSLDPSSLCLEGTLNPRVVAGKIVICDRGISPRVEKGQVAKQAGAVGMILANTAANGEELVADCHLLPAVAVGEKEGKLIKSYASTSRNATATLAFLGTRLGIRPSPVVAAFSSRGPNLLTLEILKPDIVAPGVNILAAWTGELGPSSLPTDRRRVEFNILSGTSMSCPHVSGIAALLKARHPEWSPAAIKSALMTTAYVHDNTHHPLKDASVATPSTPFDHGAGHVNPMKALDPGLIYDLEPQDYFDFLCTQKLTPAQLKVFGKFANRSCRHSLANPGDLNYPSMSAVFPEDTSIKVLTLHRTVTNVGPPTSTYHVVISPFKGATVKVEPEVLNFTRKNQKLSYRIIFTTKIRQTMPEFGGLVWKDGARKVRSPITITWLTPLT